MSTQEHRLGLTESRLIDGIDCVELRVQELDQSISFYESVIGLMVLDRSRHRAALGTEVDQPLLVIDDDGVDQPTEKQAPGLFHIAFRVPDRRALGNTLARISDAGLRIGAADHSVSEALYIDDPDHNGVEIYCDRPQDQWPPPDGDSVVPMTTDELNLQSLFAAGDGSDGIGKGCPMDTDIGHIHLQVSNIADADEFYADAIGLDIIQRRGNSARFYSSNAYHHHIGANIWNSDGATPASSDTAGLQRVVFSARNGDELQNLSQRLNRRGIQYDAGGGRLTVDDPDETTLQFVG